MKKKKPVTSAGLFWKNPTSVLLRMNDIHKELNFSLKLYYSEEKVELCARVNWNGPHPAESLDASGMILRKSRFVAIRGTGERSTAV